MWCDGMEILNLLIFNKWLELNANQFQLNLRMDWKELCMFTQGKNNVFDLDLE